MPINIFDHRGMAQDDLSDGVIQNIAAQLTTTPTPGAAASGIRVAGLVAATAGLNTTETILVKSALLLPTRTDFGQTLPGTLNVGSLIRVTINGTCTSTNADVSTFTMRAGILGTTADASIATWVVTSSGSGTAIPFTVVINVTVRTLGASGTAYGTMSVQNTGVTGIAAVTNTVVASASAITALPTTTATFLDFSYVSAATTTTCTFQAATLEIYP